MNRILFYDGDGTPGPKLCCDAGTLAIASFILGGVSTGVSYIQQSNAQSAAKKQLSAQNAQQQQLLARQTAIQARTQQQTNTQTATIDKQLAGEQAAVLARRGNGGLSYTGPTTQLKSTLGG